jgi:GTPase SAR1 family protein
MMIKARSCRVVLAGEKGVGKTHLAHRLAHSRLPKDIESTLGVEYFSLARDG